VKNQSDNFISVLLLTPQSVSVIDFAVIFQRVVPRFAASANKIKQHCSPVHKNEHMALFSRP